MGVGIGEAAGTEMTMQNEKSLYYKTLSKKKEKYMYTVKKNKAGFDVSCYITQCVDWS